MSYGRRRIFTDETEISTENVIAEVEAAFLVHTDNRAEVEKLYQYVNLSFNNNSTIPPPYKTLLYWKKGYSAA